MFLQIKKILTSIKSKIFFCLGYLGFKKIKLPDFLIIGTQKGGTTSLFNHLVKHPKIEMSPNFIDGRFFHYYSQKEVHFFNSNFFFKKGIRWYKSIFNNNNKLQGEKTPNYISNFKAHERMFEIVPNAKLILILRNPIDRAFSAYNHQKQQSVCWDKIIDIQKQNFNEIISLNTENLIQTNLIKRGFYVDQIENLYKYFKSEQVLILISEHMKKDPQAIYNKIFEFLGVETMQIEYKPNIHKREYQETMSLESRKKLEEIYKPYNERLFKLLGYRIEEWN